MSKPTFKELQKQAAELGMEKVVGVKREELEAYISEHSPAGPEEPVDPERPTEKKSATKATVAVVYRDKGVEVRRYTREQHGDDFAGLAEEFANRPERQGMWVECIQEK